MAGVGFEGALGTQGLYDTLRQQVMDRLQQQMATHQMGVEDQKLELEKERYAQEAADRAQLRDQQGRAFNETVAEKTAANLGPGQTVVSPELAKRFVNTSLAPLVQPDQTLPSTSMAAGAPLAGASDTSTAPAVTQSAPQLTGQLRFMGTPIANAQQSILNSPLLKPEQKLAFQAENAGLKVPSNVFEPKDTSALDEARIQALTANAQNAAERARLAGDNVSARSEAERARLELEQAKLDFAKRSADTKTEEWTPLPGGQLVRDPATGNYGYPFANKKGETKIVPLPAGASVEKPTTPGLVTQGYRWLFGTGNENQPQVEHWTRDANGRLVKQ